jgi:hypothetical protein
VFSQWFSSTIISKIFEGTTIRSNVIGTPI